MRLARGQGSGAGQEVGLPFGCEARGYSVARTGKWAETGQGVEKGFQKELGVENLQSDR